MLNKTRSNTEASSIYMTVLVFQPIYIKKIFFKGILLTQKLHSGLPVLYLFSCYYPPVLLIQLVLLQQSTHVIHGCYAFPFLHHHLAWAFVWLLKATILHQADGRQLKCQLQGTWSLSQPYCCYFLQLPLGRACQAVFAKP